MKYKILYCPKCFKEISDTWDFPDTGKCECGEDLMIAYKIIEKDYSCVKFDKKLKELIES